ncbi:hypothetical protein JK358_31570 [Nocardia sp. 2]|uniref:Mce-associated membrane protein n=1 Tax=Nocardia acididurans TaxID=2802282 RepID=A0ABS1MIA4_9NOCA|nr:hypothetical protein [Nocardia acididurans]MBL1078953.1 hypothetical protein [Nocardia acididurans]
MNRWKKWSDNGIHVPLLGVAAALLAVATVLGVLSYRNWDLSNRNDALTASVAELRRKEADCTAAIQAGTEFLMASNNFDYRTPEEWTRRMAALTSGPVHDYFANDQVAQANTQLITAGKLQKTSTVADAACADQTDTAVRVIAQITEKTQNFQTPDAVQTTSAVWVEVSRADGAWKTIDSGRGDQALTDDAIVGGTTAPTTQPR